MIFIYKCVQEFLQIKKMVWKTKWFKQAKKLLKVMNAEKLGGQTKSSKIMEGWGPAQGGSL